MSGKVLGAQGSTVSATFLEENYGDSDVKLGAETKRVPAYRIPKWPYFEGYQKDLHPEMAGLFGLSALGFRRVVIDAKAGTMKLGPIQALPTN